MTQLDVGRQASAGRAISAGSMPGSTVFASRASSSGPTTISPQVKCRTYSPLRGYQHRGASLSLTLTLILSNTLMHPTDIYLRDAE